MPRSEPLVLNKETGEPLERCLPWTYRKYEPWKVVILDTETRKRRSRKFFSYQEAKREAERIQEKMGEAVITAVVSRQVGHGPPYSKITDGQLLRQNELGKWWCPYCRKIRRFMHNAWRELRVCEVCGASESDFHVIKCNPLLWGSDALERM